MSIKRLQAAGLLDIEQYNGRQSKGEGSAVAFVLDQKFLVAFKVLLFSLAKTGSLSDLPIFVFTQDPVVQQDRIVKAVADKIVFLSDEDIAQFKVISSRRIPDQYKLDWIPKYTFLKWSLFDDYDIESLLFIDADIVCLNFVDDIFDVMTSAGLIGCPRFMETLFNNEHGKKLPRETIFKNLVNMVRGDFDHRHIRLNSGVLLLQGNVLSRAFRTDLLQFAAAKEYVNEQSYFTAFLKSNEKYAMSFVASKYNYGAGALAHLPVSDQLKIMNEIVFLHFPGPKKPWIGAIDDDSRLTHMVWRKMFGDAKSQSDLFDGVKTTAAVSEADM